MGVQILEANADEVVKRSPGTLARRLREWIIRSCWIAICWLPAFGAPAQSRDGESPTMFSLEGGKVKLYWREKEFSGASPYRMFAASDGTMWFVSKGAVIRSDGWTWERVGESVDLGTATIRNISETSDGTVWFATTRGLVCYRQGAFHRLTAEDGLPGSTARGVVEDPEDRLWTITESGIARVSFDEAGNPRCRPEGIPYPDPFVAHAEVAPDGTVWFMVWEKDPEGSALLHYDGSAWWNYEIGRLPPFDLPHRCLHDLAVDADGRVIITACHDVHRLEDSQWNLVVQIPFEAQYKQENEILITRDGAVWVFNFGSRRVTPDSTERAAVVRIEDGESTFYSVAGNRAGDYVLCMAECPDGSLLAGTYSGIRRFDGESWNAWPTGTDLDRDQVQQILVAGDDSVWFRSESGVARYAMAPGPPRMVPDGPWPERLGKASVEFDLVARDRWRMAESMSIEVTLDGKQIHRQPANRPIFLERLSHGNHVLEILAIDENGTPQGEPLLHSFAVVFPLWQRWDLLMIVLIAIVFIAAPSLAYASYKHLRLRQSLADLRVANVRLQEADQIKSDFVANVSHELRTPLTAIKGYVDNLLDGIGGPVSDKQVRSLHRVKANADRLGRLIGDLLDLRRIESGRIKIHPVKVHLPDVASNTIDALMPHADEKNIELRLEADEDCPPVFVDRDRIAQIYTNIIGNALKFTPANGRITVVVRGEDSGKVYSAVTDTGPGIPSGEQSRVFDRFHQVARGVTGQTGGAGLGLAICKELIELHHGTMGVESTYGQGSTFYFRLPPMESAKEGAAHGLESARR